MKIDRWFQGPATCKEYYTGFSYSEPEPRNEMSHCLWTQAMYDKVDTAGISQIADIIVRHFAARTTCQMCDFSPTQRIIHFNNHRETTREDVDKVMRIFTQETGCLK